ncbi:unnamed protein product [Tuber aestivum]|uniref:Guanine nucleotide-exchange factor SEC12 n=1 Tax=Tuber aestivum TaxID=59557 RepID=A0A292PT25_9PEZI|nr:unnamed protein product [Tuber aestivum]
MAPSITSERLKLSYPLYGASFIDADRLIVAGGGGEGRSGVGNKIVGSPLAFGKLASYTSTKPGKSLAVASEIGLSKDEDAVMSLSALNTPSGVKALVGINSARKSKSNEHFRVFDVPKEGEISLASKHALFSQVDAETYQRLVRVDVEGKIAVIASASGLAPVSAAEVVVLDVSSLNVKRRIRLPGKEEVADLDISREGNRVVCCSPGNIYIASTEKEEQGLKPVALKWGGPDRPKGSFRSIRFSGDGKLVAVYNLSGRSGAVILLVDASGEVISRRSVHSGVKAVTSTDSLALSPTSTLLAVAGADQSVQLFLVEGLIKAVKTFKNVHSFQITKLAFSPLPSSGTTVKLATTSMGNSVVVFYIPVFETEGKWQLRQTSMKLTAFLVLISLVGVVVFAVALQLMFNARAGFGKEQGRTEKFEHPSKTGLEAAEAADEWMLGEAEEVGAGVVDGMLGEVLLDVVE